MKFRKSILRVLVLPCLVMTAILFQRCEKAYGLPGGGNIPIGFDPFFPPVVLIDSALEYVYALRVPGLDSAMGFKQNDPDSLNLAEPITICYIDQDDILNYTLGTDVNMLLGLRLEYMFPVMTGGQTRCSIHLGPINSRWEILSLGQPRLTKNLFDQRGILAIQEGLPESNFFAVFMPAIYQHVLAWHKSGKLWFTPIFENEWTSYPAGSVIRADSFLHTAATGLDPIFLINPVTPSP